MLSVLQKELTDDCVFNEMLEQHYYNSYTSAKYSSRGRSLYLALDRRGAPRRVQLRRDTPHAGPHGRLAAYTRVLTKPVPADRVADLLNRLRGAVAGGGPVPGVAPHFRHRSHHAACPPHGHPESTPRRPRRCPRPGLRKQNSPRRQPGSTAHRGLAPAVAVSPGAPPPVAVAPSASAPPSTPAVHAAPARPTRRKCEATEDEDLCHKRLQMIAAKKRKSRNEKKPHHKRHKPVVKKVKTPVPTLVPISTPTPPSPIPTFTPTVASSASHPSNSSQILNQRGSPLGSALGSSLGPGLPPDSDSEEDDGDHDQEDDEDAEQEDRATATAEMVTTTMSLDEAMATAAGVADDP